MTNELARLQEMGWLDLITELRESKACQHREGAAWLEVSARLRTLARRWVDQIESAEEVASNLIAKMLERKEESEGVLARICRSRRPCAYVATMVRNEALRLRQRECRREQEHLSATLESRESDGADNVLIAELRDALLGRYEQLMGIGLSTGELTSADFNVLREWAYGTPARQMAAKRGINESAMRKRIERAKERYRRVFSGNAAPISGGRDFASELASTLERAAERVQSR